MSKEKIPIEQQSGAWNRKRHKKNLEEYRKQYGTPAEARVFFEKFPDDLEGTVEVSVLSDGKAGGLRYHLTSRKESSHFHGEHRS